MDIRIKKKSENNRRGDANRDDRENIRNQRDQPTNNVERDLGIKFVIPEYDGKLNLEGFMDWLVSKKIFSHKSMTEGLKVTQVTTRF